jgi:hypothetical protein
MIAAAGRSFTPAFTAPAFPQPSRKTLWQRAVWNSDLPCPVKGFLQNLAVGWMDADGGSCFPSEEQMMERLGCSRPALTGWIGIAVAAGYLERWRYGRGIGNRRYNYRAAFPAETDAPPPPAPAPAEIDKLAALSPAEIGKIAALSPAEIGKIAALPPAEIGNFPADKPGPNINHEQREREPDPAPALSISEKVVHLAAKTGAPDQLPLEWIEAGRLLRPDLPVEVIDKSGAIFLDHHRAKGTQFVNWLPAWRNWLRRERAPQAAPQARPAAPAPSRYPTPEQQQAPLPACVRAALAASEQRRIAQLLAAGIDPATGSRKGAGGPPDGPAAG